MGKKVLQSVDDDLNKYGKIPSSYDSLDSQIDDYGVNVKHYGAIGDGSSHPLSSKYSTLALAQKDYPHATALTDEIDWCAIQGCINLVNSLTRKPVIVLPIGNYRINKSLTLYSNIAIKGVSVKVSEFQKHVQLTTVTAANTFVFSGSDMTNIHMSNIEFYGHTGANFLEQQNQGTGYILKYSSFHHCGFNFYNYVFNGRWLGVHFYENHINNGNYAWNLAGADSVIRDNFISVSTSAPNTQAVCYFTAMSLTMVERNFITGLKPRCMSFDASKQMTISNNWLDISDTCGVYATNSERLMFIGNSFNRLCAAVFNQYDAQVVLYDVTLSSFIGNHFDTQATGRTISLRKTTTGTSDISFRANKFKNLVLNVPTGEASNIDFDSVSGSVVPTQAYYKQGQTYVKTDTGEAYLYLGSTWKKITTV